MGFKLSAGNTLFKLHDGTALRDVSAYTEAVEGLPGEREAVDVTAFTDTGTKAVPGTSRGRFTVRFLFHDGSNATWDVLKALHADPAARAFEYYPDGVKKVSGDCYLIRLGAPTRAGETVRMTAEFHIQGAVTLA